VAVVTELNAQSCPGGASICSHLIRDRLRWFLILIFSVKTAVRAVEVFEHQGNGAALHLLEPPPSLSSTVAGAMSCFSCSRKTLSLFIRSIHPEYRFPLPRPPPSHLLNSRDFSIAHRLCHDANLSEDLQTPAPPSPVTDASTEGSSANHFKRKARIKRTPDAHSTERIIERPKPKEQWQIQKAALKEKFGDKKWEPRKKLSPDAMEGIRHLHKTQPDRFTTPVLAEYFKVSPEAIRRILKSKWRPSDEEEDERIRRWDKRGERIWANLVELGVKPPKKWRDMGVGRAQPGEVPLWKGRWRNRVSVNDSIRDDIIPIVNEASEESGPNWNKIPITSRMF